MKGATHLAAGAAIGLFVSSQQNLSLPETLLATSFCMIGSLLPDIDNMTSRIGKKTPVASMLIQLFIGHRTVFHAPLPYIALAFVITGAVPILTPIILACCLGITTHLLLDMMNPAGVPLFWPIPYRIHLSDIPSGGILDWLLTGLFWTLTAVQLLRYIF